VLNGRQLTLNQLQDVCNAGPFLSLYRLVIVEGLLERFELKSEPPGRSDASKTKAVSTLKEWQGLADYAKQMPPTTVLVIVEDEIKDKTNSLLKSLKVSAQVFAFLELRGKELQCWIQERVKEGGGSIVPGSVALLVNLVGGDLWAMNGEIDKLLAYSSGRPISEDDVRQVASYARETSIFALVDAVLEGRRKEGQQLLHRLLQDGSTPSYILAMIVRQLRLIVVAKEMGRKIFEPEVRNNLERPKDFALEKALRQAKSYTLERMKEAYHKLLENDIAIKTGKYDGDLALNLLIVELSH
jgi:DNA polymerase-3 subunit delta